MNANQFKITAEVGTLDFTLNADPNVLQVTYDRTATSTTYLVPGEGVVFADLSTSEFNGGLPVVKKRANDNTDIEGVVIRNQRTNKHYPNAVLEVARRGAIVRLKASGTIARNDKVAFVLSTAGLVIKQTDEAILGKALDHATNGQFIRIEIYPESVAAPST